jgi:hypothetical protein
VLLVVEVVGLRLRRRRRLVGVAPVSQRRLVEPGLRPVGLGRLR